MNKIRVFFITVGFLALLVVYTLLILGNYNLDKEKTTMHEGVVLEVCDSKPEISKQSLIISFDNDKYYLQNMAVSELLDKGDSCTVYERDNCFRLTSNLGNFIIITLFGWFVIVYLYFLTIYYIKVKSTVKCE